MIALRNIADRKVAICFDHLFLKFRFSMILLFSVCVLSSVKYVSAQVTLEDEYIDGINTSIFKKRI